MSVLGERFAGEAVDEEEVARDGAGSAAEARTTSRKDERAALAAKLSLWQDARTPAKCASKPLVFSGRARTRARACWAACESPRAPGVSSACATSQSRAEAA